VDEGNKEWEDEREGRCRGNKREREEDAEASPEPSSEGSDEEQPSGTTSEHEKESEDEDEEEEPENIDEEEPSSQPIECGMLSPSAVSDTYVPSYAADVSADWTDRIRALEDAGASAELLHKQSEEARLQAEHNLVGAQSEIANLRLQESATQQQLEQVRRDYEHKDQEHRELLLKERVSQKKIQGDAAEEDTGTNLNEDESELAMKIGHLHNERQARTHEQSIADLLQRLEMETQDGCLARSQVAELETLLQYSEARIQELEFEVERLREGEKTHKQDLAEARERAEFGRDGIGDEEELKHGAGSHRIKGAGHGLTHLTNEKIQARCCATMMNLAVKSDNREAIGPILWYISHCKSHRGTLCQCLGS